MSYRTFVVSYSSKSAARAEAAKRSTSGLLIVFDPLWVNLPERGLLLHECGHLELCDNWNFTSVFSPFWRLYWNSKPGFSMDFSGQIIDLTPDNLVLIPPHCSYDCWTNNPTPHFWIHFTYHKTPAHSEAIVIKPREAELCVIKDLKEVIKHSRAEETPERGRLLASSLAQIAISRTEIEWKQSLPANLARLQRHIDEHFGEDLSNPALAKFAGTSLTGLLRLFNRHRIRVQPRDLVANGLSVRCHHAWEAGAGAADHLAWGNTGVAGRGDQEHALPGDLPTGKEAHNLGRLAAAHAEIGRAHV